MQGQAAQSEIAIKSPQARSLEIQWEAQTSHLASLKAQYEPMLEELRIVKSQAQKSKADVEAAQSKISKHESDLVKMKSLFAKMVEIGNKSAAKAGGKVTEAMVVADTLPPEHLAHTKVFDEALKQGDKVAFDLALSKLPDEDVNYRDSKGKTLLMYAAANGYVHGVDALLKKGANPDLYDKDGFNAIYYSAKCPHTKILKSLASATNDINHRYVGDRDDTAINVMIRANGVFYVEKQDVEEGLGCLYLTGGNIIMGEDGLNMSIAMGKGADGFSSFEAKILDLIRHFIECGANINITGNHGLNAFTLSCLHRFSYLVSRLLEDYDLNLDQVDITGRSTLSYSTELSDIGTLEKVVSKTQSLMQKDYQGRNCLHIMATETNAWSDEVASLLLEKKYCNINETSLIGMTVISFAAQYNRTDIMEFCLSKNSNLMIATNEGILPWHMAAYFGSLEALQKLRPYYELDTASQNDYGYTAIRYSIQQSNLKTTQYLLEEGVNPNQKSHTNGYSLMHLAAQKADLQTIYLLLKHGAEIDTLSKEGKSPLFVLAEQDNISSDSKTLAIKYLLLKGAKLGIQDTEGHTLTQTLEKHFPPAKDLIRNPESLPPLEEFEQKIIGDIGLNSE